MHGLAASSKLSLAAMVVVLLLGRADAAHGLTRVVANSSNEPCKNMALYYHDILYNGNNAVNATTAAATKPTTLSMTYWKNITYFGASMCANKDLAIILRKFLHPNNLSEFLDLTDIHGHLISPYAKWVEQWV
ncbi:hypothetical protein VPH35_035624 [Triticum aestivum]